MHFLAQHFDQHFATAAQRLIKIALGKIQQRRSRSPVGRLDLSYLWNICRMRLQDALAFILLCLDQISSYSAKVFAARQHFEKESTPILPKFVSRHCTLTLSSQRAELTLYLDESRDREMIAKMQDALANGHVVLKGSSLDDIDLSAIDLTQLDIVLQMAADWGVKSKRGERYTFAANF